MTQLADYAPVLCRLDRLRVRSAERAVARCPAHEDRTPSLSLWLGRSGCLLLGCWAGCPKGEILSALGLRWADLFPPKEGAVRTVAARKEIAVYPYCDEYGEILYEKVRYDPKDFRTRRPPRPDDAPAIIHDGCCWNLDGCPRVLYRLPEIVESPPERWLLLVAGEKDCESARGIGVVATTNVEGESAAWLPEYTQALAGRRVAVVADDDAPGWAHAAKVAYALAGRCAAVRLVLGLPGVPPKGDCSDYLDALGDVPAREKKLRLWELVRAAPLVR